MAEKTTVVRARASEKDVRTLTKLAKEDGIKMSEVIRRLVTHETQRRTRQAQMRPYSYLSEKIGQALQMLTLRDDPDTMVQAFSVLGRGFASKLPAFPPDDIADPTAWCNTVMAAISPTEEDLADPRAASKGGYWVRAERLTRDEKHALATALWNLLSYFEQDRT